MTKGKDHLRGILYLRYSTHNMNTMKNFLLCSALLGLMAWSGCKRCNDPSNPACENFDPCWDAQSVSADFVMGQTFTNRFHPTLQDTFLVVDTILEGQPMTEFRGPEGYDRYEWTIGQDDRTFTDQTVYLFFVDPEPLLRIQLIVEREPDTACFPGEDGRDTAVQYLTVVPPTEPAIRGSYQGVLASAPNDSFEVSIGPLPQYPTERPKFLFNINPGCIPEGFAGSSEIGGQGYRVLSLNGGDEYVTPTCDGVVAWCFLDSTNRFLHIDYKTREPYHRDQFHGIKID